MLSVLTCGCSSIVTIAGLPACKLSWFGNTLGLPNKSNTDGCPRSLLSIRQITDSIYSDLNILWRCVRCHVKITSMIDPKQQKHPHNWWWKCIYFTRWWGGGGGGGCGTSDFTTVTFLHWVTRAPTLTVFANKPFSRTTDISTMSCKNKMKRMRMCWKLKRCDPLNPNLKKDFLKVRKM